MAFAGTHDPISAMKAYRTALARRSDYLPALEGAAQVEFDRNGADAALLLEQVAALRPDDSTTNAMLGVLAFRRGDCEKAALRFGAAAAAIDSQLGALSEYAFCLARLERYAEAVQVLNRATVLDSSPRSRFNLALVEWKANRYDEALSTLASELAADTPDENVLTLGASIHESENETPSAVAMLRRAVSLHPQESEAYLAFATISNDHGSYQVGIDMLNAGISRMPKEASLYLARGVLNAQKGDLDQAIDDFQSANRIDPRISFSGTAEAIAQVQRHDPEKALSALREESRRHPDNAFNQYMIAETIAQMGPREGSALYAEELRTAREAVRLDSHLAVARNLLGSAFLQAGNYAQAINESRSVLASEPENQEALYHLILALKKSGRTTEIPALTSQLIHIRKADRDAKSHMVRYELVETAAATSSP
jgi:tetratricopeptide (TPR) repeat protein